MIRLLKAAVSFFKVLGFYRLLSLKYTSAFSSVTYLNVIPFSSLILTTRCYDVIIGLFVLSLIKNALSDSF